MKIDKILVTVPVYHDFFKYESDLIKKADALELKKPFVIINTNLPKTFHTDGLVNSEFNNLIKKDFLNYLNKENVEIFSFDIGPSAELVEPCEKCFWIGKSKILSEKEIFDIATKKINEIRKMFNGKIIVENLDYHKGGAYEFVCMPKFISRFVKEMDVGFLLDIAHAKVSANALGIDFENYLNGLPLEKVEEIHICHCKTINDEIEDSHEALEQKDFEELKEIIKKTPNVRFIVIEYYKDIKKIIKNYERLRMMLDEINKNRQ